MKCKVICASLGYNDRVYCNGDYVEVFTSKEVKRLASHGSIEVGTEEIKPEKENVIAVKPPVKKVSNIKRKGGIKKDE